MQFATHINITGDALKRWFVAQCYDSVCVGLLWWAGLSFLHVPWAPFWGALAAALQFIPHFGTALSFVGPGLAALSIGWETFVYVLMLYGGIVLVEGLVLQPLIMRKTARVPIWASLIVPILLSMFFGFWGLLLAAPLLAVIFAYRAMVRKRGTAAPGKRQTPPGHDIEGGVLISPSDSAGNISRGE